MTDRSELLASGVPADLLDDFDAHGLAPDFHLHPPVFTVEDADAHRDDRPGAHTKNLFFKDAGGRLWLLTALAERRLDLKKLPQLMGSKRLSFGSADLLVATLGVQPGSVSPLAAMRDRAGKVTSVLDAALMAADFVNVHPLVNTATIGLTPDELVSFLRRHAHEPVVLDLDR